MEFDVRRLPRFGRSSRERHVEAVGDVDLESLAGGRQFVFDRGFLLVVGANGKGFVPAWLDRRRLFAFEAGLIGAGFDASPGD